MQFPLDDTLSRSILYTEDVQSRTVRHPTWLHTRSQRGHDSPAAILDVIQHDFLSCPCFFTGFLLVQQAPPPALTPLSTHFLSSFSLWTNAYLQCLQRHLELRCLIQVSCLQVQTATELHFKGCETCDTSADVSHELGPVYDQQNTECKRILHIRECFCQ